MAQLSTLSPENFINTFSPAKMEQMMLQNRDAMITSEHIPSINMVRNTYNHGTARVIVEALLFGLADAMGTTNTASSIEAIADDIIGGYGDFKVTEVALAFRLMREGRIRLNDRNDGAGRNAAEMYGRLSSAVICDCLHRYRFDHRNKVIDKMEREKAEQEREQAPPPATPQERRRINIAGAMYRARGGSLPLLTASFTKDEMKALEYYAAERRANILLRQRVEQFLNGEIEAEALRKGIDYLNEHFPLNEDTTDPLIFKS